MGAVVLGDFGADGGFGFVVHLADHRIGES